MVQFNTVLRYLYLLQNFLMVPYASAELLLYVSAFSEPQKFGVDVLEMAASCSHEICEQTCKAEEQKEQAKICRILGNKAE